MTTARNEVRSMRITLLAMMLAIICVVMPGSTSASGGGGYMPSFFGFTNTTTVNGSVLGASTFNFTCPMVMYSRGNQVTELQNYLLKSGYFFGSATGYFGSQTAMAVKKLQAAHGLEQVGHVGPQTCAILNAARTTSAVPTFKTVNRAEQERILGILRSSLTELQARFSFIASIR